MSLHQKDRGYSFYDAMNSRLSFMYFSRNGGVRDVVHSVVTFFLWKETYSPHLALAASNPAS